MQRFLVGLAAAAALAVPGLAHAVAFTGTYGIDANTDDPGLQVSVIPDSGPLNFTLDNPGDTFQTSLFSIFADESFVNSDDTVPQPITATFNFTAPPTSGQVDGETVGRRFGFFGLIQDGSVTWNGPTTVGFGGAGQLQIDLSDETFGFGIGGLNQCCGAAVDGTFTLVQAPEPATLAVIGAGLAGIGLAARRRRAA